MVVSELIRIFANGNKTGKGIIMTTVQMSALNADILRNLGTIAQDEGKLKRAAKYLRRLAMEMAKDPTEMTEEEFFAKIERAEQQIANGEGMEMLPGEDLTAFLKRNGYNV